MDDLLTVLGLLLVLEGLPYFAFPERFKSWIARVLDLPESTLRIYGFISMVIGLFLIYLARRSGWLH
jgi:uncharacterized protein YjeT (DUF2065 family)